MTELHNLRKLYFEEGKSITEISRETGRDRKTVRVYLEKEDWNDVRVDPWQRLNSPNWIRSSGIDTWLTEESNGNKGIRPADLWTAG